MFVQFSAGGSVWVSFLPSSRLFLGLQVWLLSVYLNPSLSQGKLCGALHGNAGTQEGKIELSVCENQIICMLELLLS